MEESTETRTDTGEIGKVPLRFRILLAIYKQVERWLGDWALAYQQVKWQQAWEPFVLAKIQQAKETYGPAIVGIVIDNPLQEPGDRDYERTEVRDGR